MAASRKGMAASRKGMEQERHGSEQERLQNIQQVFEFMWKENSCFTLAVPPAVN
jgi:hypothetical protein